MAIDTPEKGVDRVDTRFDARDPGEKGPYAKIDALIETTLSDVPDEARSFVRAGLLEKIQGTLEARYRVKDQDAGERQFAAAFDHMVLVVDAVRELFRFRDEKEHEAWRNEYDRALEEARRNNGDDPESNFLLACDWAKKRLRECGLRLEKTPTVQCRICKTVFMVRDREGMELHKSGHQQEGKVGEQGIWFAGDAVEALLPKELKDPVTPEEIFWAGVVRVSGESSRKGFKSEEERTKWYADHADIVAKAIAAYTAAASLRRKFSASAPV